MPNAMAPDSLSSRKEAKASGNDRFIVGLTGGIGSGKSTVANLFKQLGIPAVDADIVAREVVAPGSPLLAKIATQFGPQLLTADNSLNPPLLRQLIFSDTAAKKWLDNLMHPAIRSAMLAQLQQLPPAPYVLLIAPLLLENKLHTLVNRVLVVDITEQNQLARTLSRDAVHSGANAKQVQAIIASQISRSERLALADDIIDNNADIHDFGIKSPDIENRGETATLQQQVRQLHQHYITLAANE